ncbi:PHD finger protein 12 [Lycorma delicatula]|uniref:PHD finger protein 12 n=1 Tax=Lycorma delicatula TaxID=130591 RepID=UPI003F510D45
MSNVEYDLDTTKGLMPQVQALIAPPVSDDAKTKKKEGLDLHPYYKRPGKGHNRDTCDACQEGGNLLCCDRCPASFHFICVNPPIEEEKDIPLGGWACNKCTYELKSEEEAKTNKGKTRKSTALTKRELRAKEREEKNLPEEALNLRNAFRVLTNLAEQENPKEFTLPKELHSPFQFPGTDKVVPAKVSARRSSVTKRKPYELDSNGNVPLPAKCCFRCGKSCRLKRMVACDYCPLFFHLDCLDPPLASRPDKNWMCPNHNQHFLDNFLLKTESYTERVTMWEKFALQPVDQHTIKLDFIRKRYDGHALNRFHVRSAPRFRVQVPESIKAAYANPGPLLPALHEFLRLKSAVDNTRNACCSHCPLKIDRVSDVDSSNVLYRMNDFKTITVKSETTKKEQEQWISAVLKMHVDYAQEFGIMSQNSDKDKVENDVEIIDESKVECSKQEMVKTLAPETVTASSSESFNGVVSSAELKDEVSTICNGDRQNLNGHLYIESSETKENNAIMNDLKRKLATPLNDPKRGCALSVQVNEKDYVKLSDLNALNEDVIKLLAYQRLQQLKTETSPPTAVKHSDSTSTSSEKEILQKLKNIDPSVLSKKNKQIIIKTPQPPLRKQVQIIKQTIPVGVHALLAPVKQNPGPLFIMSYECTTTVGNGSSCSVILRNYSHCNFINDFHASIHYNKVLQKYELVNYSRYGTVVNNRRFGTENIKSEPEQVVSRLKKTVNEIIAERKNELIKKLKTQQKENSQPGCKTIKPCKCMNTPHELPCWEGPADLFHGTYIQFGCLEFVFSIIDVTKRLTPIKKTTCSSSASVKSSDIEECSRPSTSGVNFQKKIQ